MKKFRKDISLEGNIYKLYAFSFFHNLIFAYVIERLFALQRGLIISQMVFLEIIYGIAVSVLEIPTGAIADKWSRKNVLILSAIFSFFEFFTLIFAYNFGVFVLSTLFAAISGALASGTINALFYDSLKLVKKESEFEKVSGRNRFFENFSALAAGLTGAFVASRLTLVSTYLFSLISVLISIFITFTITEPEIKRSFEAKYSLHIKNALLLFKNSNALKFIVFYGAIISTIFIYVDEFWQIYLKDINIPLVFFGFFSAFITIVDATSSIFSYKLKEKFSSRFIFSSIVVLLSMSLVISGFNLRISGVIPLVILFSLFGVVQPLISGFIHHRVESKIRATAESIYSFVLRISTVLIGLAFGFISTKFNIFIGFRLLGFVMIAYTLYYFIFTFKSIKE